MKQQIEQEARKITHVIIFVEQRAQRIIVKNIKAAYRHPHHYGTALGCTVIMLVLGHFDAAAVSGFWVYALCENFFGGDA